MAITKLSSGSSFTNLTKYDSFLAGNNAFSPSSYESIATVTVGSGGSSSISFSSIPSTFTHLQIRGISKNTTSSTDCNITINSGTAAAYRHQLFGDGSTASALATSGNAYLIMTAGSTTANTFDASVIDFLDYSSTTKNKVVRALSGRDLNGSGLLSFGSALWTTTTAISQISITPFSGNIAQYSQFALYGIKG